MLAAELPGDAAPSRDLPLLNGMSWQGFDLIALLYGLWTLHWMLSPSRTIVLGGMEFVSAWLALWGSILVGGESLYIVIVMMLNGAALAGLNRAWIVVPVAAVGSLIVALLTSIVGSAPTGLGHGVASGIGRALFWADWATAIAVGYLVLMRMRTAQAATRYLALQRKARENQRLEGRLRLLQAQIEPHFLFNTLSNIRRLCQQDVPGGRAMLAQLVRYLRAALPKIRRDLASIADEIDLVGAYLALHKIRMGERLSVSMDVAEDCLTLSVPPMMLVTLAENAIKHGLAPLSEGGSIAIQVVREGSAVKLCVIDTGQGFVAESGRGVGLANLRAQLSTIYGRRATLTLQGNAPHGVRATITLPCQTEESAP